MKEILDDKSYAIYLDNLSTEFKKHLKSIEIHRKKVEAIQRETKLNKVKYNG